MNTETKFPNTINAAALTIGDVVNFGGDNAIIEDVAPSIAYPNMMHVWYRYEGTDVVARGFYRTTERFEVAS